MTKINDGGQAFPSHPILYSSEDAWMAQGMSLRDWFAARAPERPLYWPRPVYPEYPAFPNVLDGSVPYELAMEAAQKTYRDECRSVDLQRIDIEIRDIARWGYAYADAMIAAREAGGE
jgi:hypothetical protein